MPVQRLSRKSLLRHGVAGGAALAGLGLAAPARADAPPDADLAYLRLAVGAELLKADFERRALGTGKVGKAATRLVARMRADDAAHYRALAALLSGAGQTAATAADVDFAYARGSFASGPAILKRAAALASLSLGAYLGAVENVATPELRLPLAQIAANEAQQLSALGRLLGRPQIGSAFPAALSIDAVSAALDRYES